MAKIVVVIPTYNERESTEKMIEVLAEVFGKIEDHEVHLLYVDDTSPDKTYEVIQEKMKKYRWLHLLLNPEKLGIGGAYVKGFKYAMKELNADYIVEFDGDFQHRPVDLPKLIEKIDEGYDYIIGSRYIRGGSIPKNWSFKRKFLSVVGNWVARILLLQPKIHDITTGFKITKVKGFMDQAPLDTLYSTRFAYKLHLFADIVSRGAKTVEVPIIFENREEGKSKIINNDLLETIKVMVLFQFNNPKIRRFMKFAIVGFIGFLVNSIGIELFVRSQLTSNLAYASQSLSRLPGLKIFTEKSSWAGALGAEMAIISNFILNNAWTFKEKKITKFWEVLKSFIKFNVTSLGAVIIQFIVIGSAVVFFGDSIIVRQMALVFAIGFLIIPYNYTMYNLFIWKTWDINKILKINK